VQTYPARTSVELAIAGLATMAIGLVLRQPTMVAWGGALLIGLAIARLVTQIDVAGVRAAGFEMAWQGEGRRVEMARGEEIQLEAELRNRDGRAARFTGLRAACSPEIRVHVEPENGEVPGGGRLMVRIHVTAERVGRHALHGLSLELEGAPGLFEVPLTFANPFGVEVLPGAVRELLRSARGGRSRRTAVQGRPGALAGDSDSLRELREHRPGDPFRRIAWKASAKRGQLLVREYEREERDVVWVLLDASVELWSGLPGKAPLDVAIDEAATVALRHIQRGDFVGLAVVGARTLSYLEPAAGVAHGKKLASALAHSTGCLEPERSGLDEADVAARVLEHLRPLDPRAAANVRSNEIDRIARRADRVAATRAPFRAVTVLAASRRERSLRRYLASFGLGSPARLEPDRPRTDVELTRLLVKLGREKRRPSLIYLWSPPPDPATRPVLERGLATLPRRRYELRWMSVRLDTGLAEKAHAGVERVVADTVSLRAQAALRRGEKALRRLGVRLDGGVRERAGRA
jgi:uncharacterized protein (DUF58 family)